jgi:hypothetical protein
MVFWFSLAQHLPNSRAATTWARARFPRLRTDHPRPTMARKKKPKPPRNLPLDKIDFVAILHEMDAADDRAAAVVAAGFLENNLAMAILSRFRELDPAQQKELCDKEHSATGTFAAKIQVGFALQLFGAWIQTDLNAIKRIRNNFAHYLDVRSFDHAEVSGDCDKLLCLKYLTRSSMKPEVTRRRDRFLNTAAHLAERFALESRNLRRPTDPQVPSYDTFEP